LRLRGGGRGKPVMPWKSASAYGIAASTHTEHPKICRHLRSSSSSHLRRLRVSGEDIELLLGHRRPGAYGNYVEEVFEPLRAVAARLTLRFFPVESSVCSCTAGAAGAD